MAGLAKGLAIIEAFGANTTRMTISDAAHLADLSRPAARRCLLTLVELGYLAHDGKFFTPLPRMLRLGGAYVGTSSLSQIAQPLLASARDRLQESVSLTVLDEGYAVFIARAEAVRIVSTGVKIGGRLPAYYSATGRVLLGGLPEQQVRAHLESVPMKRLTHRTVANLDGVLKAIRRAAEDGYAISDEVIQTRPRAPPVIEKFGLTGDAGRYNRAAKWRRANSSSGSRCSTTPSRVMRLVDTERLMAATISPRALQIGTAIERIPISSSSSMMAYPCLPTNSISFMMLLVVVRG